MREKVTAKKTKELIKIEKGYGLFKNKSKQNKKQL